MNLYINIYSKTVMYLAFFLTCTITFGKHNEQIFSFAANVVIKQTKNMGSYHPMVTTCLKF